jgi:putative DNA primase/helicase
VFLEEADTLGLKEKHELRGILNSGWEYEFASVMRCQGDKQEVREFRTWAPKVFALIGQLPDTLADRSIVVSLKRKLPTQRMERRRYRTRSSVGTEIRRKLARFAADHREQLEQLEPELPPELDDRAADNWDPLIALAQLCGERWLNLAREAAVALQGGREDDEYRLRLLRDIRAVFGERQTIPSTELSRELNGLRDSGWSQWTNGRGMNEASLALALKDFGIRPTKWREGARTYRGYRAQDFEDAWGRYLPSVPQAPQPAQDAQSTPEFVADVADVAGGGDDL